MDNGTVYTYRWRRRAFFKKEKGSLEQTWANEKRGGKRITNVEVEEVGEIEPWATTLKPYAKSSGFKDHWAWFLKLVDMQPPVFQKTGWLYKVTRISQQLRLSSDSPVNAGADDPKTVKSEKTASPPQAEANKEKKEK